MSDDFKRCAVCGEYGFFNTKFMNHVCKPAFECRLEWHADDPDAWCRTHGSDPEEAAEKFAEDYDCNGGEYAIVSGRSRTDAIVQVRKPKDLDAEEDPPFERWAVEGETVPQYRAHKLDAA